VRFTRPPPRNLGARGLAGDVEPLMIRDDCRTGDPLLAFNGLVERDLVEAVVAEEGILSMGQCALEVVEDFVGLEGRDCE